MYPVTQDFKDAIMTPFNREVYGKIQIDYTDPFLDQSIDVSANENANVSYPFQIADSVINPVGKLLSLDGSCSLDGTYVLAPTENIVVNQIGWWGSQLSDSNRYFTATYPKLTVEFTARPILKLSVTGDSLRGEYPVDFNVHMYNDSMVLIDTHVVLGNTNMNYTYDLPAPVTGISTMELEVIRWSHSGRQVKIMEFYTSIREVYEDEDIMSIGLVEQRGDTGAGVSYGQVTSSEISISLNNADKRFTAGNKQSPLYGVIKPNRRIKPFLGIKKPDDSMEYVPLGTFWSGDWTVPSDKLYAQTRGGDKLSLMGDTLYSTVGVISNMSLYDLAYEVLNDYGFADSEFLIDVKLQDIIIPYIKYEDVNHKTVLQDIAGASMGQIYVNRDGVIIIESSDAVATSYEVYVNENANVSYPYQVVDGIYEPSGLFLSLDGYSILDGTYSFPPETIDSGEMGWWGSTLSDGSGNFSSPYPTLNITCSPKIVSNIKVNGDIKRYEYPVDFTVNVYDKDDLLLGTQSVVGNTLVERDLVLPETSPTVVRIELVVKKWNLPNAQVKILEFSDSIPSINISESMYFSKDNPLNFNNIVNQVSVLYSPFNISTDVTWGNIGDTASVDERVIVQDTNSIIDNGLLDFELSGNPLIQTETLATQIANYILFNFNNPQRDVDLQWRGNPAYLIGDIVNIYDSNEHNTYAVVGQELNYSGYLRASLKGRKVVEG